MTTFVFPGQGSQKKGMGAGLFEKFNDCNAIADEVLGYSVKELCLDDRGARLMQTQYTQPALYVVNALSYLNLIEENGERPDFVAGHSLGEYDALFAAEVFDFETGLNLVKKRGELMAQIKDGGMAAIVGLGEEKIRRVLEENDLSEIEIANLNAPGQVIISGRKESIVRAKPIFEAAGARCALLQVSGAFHSRHMMPAQREFTSFLHQFNYNDPRIPVVSNVDAKLYTKERTIDLLSRQLTSSVRWSESIQFLLRSGESKFKEVGPGNVLTKLIEKIRQVPDSELAIKSVIETTDRSVSVASPRRTPMTNGLPVETLLPVNGNGNGNGSKHHGSSRNPVTAVKVASKITACTLGDESFRRDYGIKYAYVAGGKNPGTASTELIVRMARAGLLGYFGTTGLEISEIEENIRGIQHELNPGQCFGLSLSCNNFDLKAEEAIVDCFLKHEIRNIEAISYIQISPALVRYRLKGLDRGMDGEVVCRNRVLARVTHPEVAEAFLNPAPERIVKKLLAQNKISRDEAELAAKVPLADELCIESDSFWQADQGAAHVLLPIIRQMRDEIGLRNGYVRRVRVGSAEGIGTPYAAGAAFILGADFVLTDALNQCTIEGNLSDSAKDLLEQMNAEDTEYAPAKETFELGGKVRVLKKGLLFSARSNKLYEIYRKYNSLDEIDEKTRKQLQERYFKKSFAEIYADIKSTTRTQDTQSVEEAERNPKLKMAMVFKWYLEQSRDFALNGNDERRVDYQIHCEPALGAFNHWSRGTSFDRWRNRHVDGIADILMNGAAEFLNQRYEALIEQV